MRRACSLFDNQINDPAANCGEWTCRDSTRPDHSNYLAAYHLSVFKITGFTVQQALLSV